jgi:hypothetical protein
MNARVLVCIAAAALAVPSCSAGQQEQGRLDATARTTIRTIPVPWRVTSSEKIDERETAAIGAKLGGRIEALSNATLSAFGGTVQINTIVCPTTADAEKIAAAVRMAHRGADDFVLQDGKRVIELVGPSDELCLRASYELGLRPMPETFHWRVAFDAAPVESCRDPMQWNPFFVAFLKLRSGDAAAEREIADLSKSFTFGREMTVGWEGAELTVMPAAKTSTPAGGGRVRHFFGDLPQTAGVATVHIEGTVTIPPPNAPAERPGPALTAATEFWPADDPEIVALAKRITTGRAGTEEQVEAILAWLTPNTNLRYAGPVGSRHGVKACLKGGEGRCWDFSDLFVTLCRARGIPTRQTFGWLYGADGHVWAEVYLPARGWTPYDATGAGKFQCNAFHVPWATSDDGRLSFVYVSMPEVTLETP